MTLKHIKKIKGATDIIGDFNGRCEYTLNALLLCLYKTTQLGLVTRTPASNTDGIHSTVVCSSKVLMRKSFFLLRLHEMSFQNLNTCCRFLLLPLADVV